MMRPKLAYLVLLAFLALSFPLQALELDADAYKQNSQVQFSWAVSGINDLHLDGHESILDIGCANGCITAYLATLTSGLVCGVDPSAACIRDAKLSYPELCWKQSSFEDVELAQQFDLVTCFCALNWIEDKAQFFAKVKKALKPGGRLYVVMEGSPPHGGTAVLADLLSQEAWLPHLHLFARSKRSSVDDLIHCAAINGLAPVHIREQSMPAIFVDAEELRAWNLAHRSELAQLPPEMLDSYFQALTELVRDLYPQAEDGRLYAFPRRLDMEFVRPI